MFSVPTKELWSSYWSRFLLSRADTKNWGPDNVAQQILNNTEANRKFISPFDMFSVPTKELWSSYWSRFLLGRADTKNWGPANVAQQIVFNTIANRKYISPFFMFTTPDSAVWGKHWGEQLAAKAESARRGPAAVAKQIVLNTIANKAEILAKDMFKLPDALEFFFLFADMQGSLRTGLSAAFNNMPSVEINIVDLLNFNASGITEAINDAVKEAIQDRSYDSPSRFGATGFSRGRQ